MQSILMGRHAEPREMVCTVVYLVSDPSSYTTGECRGTGYQLQCGLERGEVHHRAATGAGLVGWSNLVLLARLRSKRKAQLNQYITELNLLLSFLSIVKNTFFELD